MYSYRFGVSFQLFSCSGATLLHFSGDEILQFLLVWSAHLSDFVLVFHQDDEGDTLGRMEGKNNVSLECRTL